MDLKHCRVLVTPTSYGKHDPRLKSELEGLVGEVVYNPAGKPLTSEEVHRLLPGIDGYIAGLDVIDRDALQAADRLKVIARYGVGVDRVDLAACRQTGITVTNTPGANAAAVAELTLGFIIALARQLVRAAAATREGQFPRLDGVGLADKTIGLVGMGSVGKQVARRLGGFDCAILAHDPAPDRIFARKHRVSLVGLDELLARADFVSLHLPASPETLKLVDAAFLGKMKPGAFLVNTARGELVDDGALLEALEGGQLRGAALDVFAQEPPDPDYPLLRLPQVIATPHLGSQTDGSTNAMGWMALHDCLNVLRGNQPKYPVKQP